MDVAFNQLWQHYQNSCFLLTQSLNAPCSFAIITASNPRGQLLSSAQNRLRDKQLQQDIHVSGCAYRCLMGASPDLRHMEKSWAIYMDQQAAYQLAHKYQQNAFYFVDDGALHLIPCHCEAAPVALGDFHQFVRLVEDLPEIHD